MSISKIIHDRLFPLGFSMVVSFIITIALITLTPGFMNTVTVMICSLLISAIVYWFSYDLQDWLKTKFK